MLMKPMKILTVIVLATWSSKRHVDVSEVKERESVLTSIVCLLKDQKVLLFILQHHHCVRRKGRTSFGCVLFTDGPAGNLSD